MLMVKRKWANSLLIENNKSKKNPDDESGFFFDIQNYLATAFERPSRSFAIATPGSFTGAPT